MSRYESIENSEEQTKSLYTIEGDDDNFIYFPVIEDEIAYIGIENLYYTNIETDKNKVKKSLDMFKDYKVLIIDLRNNSGGASSYFTDMFLPMIVKENLNMEYYSLLKENVQVGKYINGLEKIMDNDGLQDLIRCRFGTNSDYILSKYRYFHKACANVIKDSDSIQYNGKLYFLVNEYTASSAAYWTAFVKDSKIGTIVGGCTASESIGSDAAMFILPKSKLMLRINDELIISENLDFKKEGVVTNGSISPDILVYSNLKEKVNSENIKYDPCVNLVLELEKAE